jgi:hypothetical protein
LQRGVRRVAGIVLDGSGSVLVFLHRHADHVRGLTIFSLHGPIIIEDFEITDPLLGVTGSSPS